MEAAPATAVDYERLVGAVREVVHRVVPINATVLVVSRGDQELLELGPRKGLHFPQDQLGKPAGYHPSDSDHAIQMVEHERERGAQFLLIPSTEFWWLDYYEGLRTYLESRYRVIEAGEDCWIAQLSSGPDLTANLVGPASADIDLMVGDMGHQLAQPLREVIGSLLPGNARIAFLEVDGNGSSGVAGGQKWLLPHEASSDPTAAIESLDRLEQSGVDFVIITHPLFDWAEEHPALLERLRSRHRFVTRQEHLCEIYELRVQAPPPPPPTPPREEAESNVESEASNARGEQDDAGRRSVGEKLRSFFSSSRRDDDRT
jgi:hypothetical protein